MLKEAPPLFKARCSSLGKLMTEPRSKKAKEAGELSATAKTYLVEWYTEQLYGRRKPLENKYLSKGTAVEDDSIAYINKVNGTNWTNNKEQFENDYLTGEPDIITPDAIYDIKSSWSCFTHPLFTKEAKPEYRWQVQGYMWLTGRREGGVVHVLMNTPESLIPFGEDSEMHNYDNIPPHLRIKTFDVEWEEDVIEQIKNKVERARAFIQAISL